MLILSLETSGTPGSVALHSDDVLLGESTLETGKKHAQSLIPTIQQLLASHQHRPAELQLIAVSIGPGSYTGLRVGVVCAKTIAWGLGCPLVAVDTLQAIAANAPRDLGPVTVIADAQRGDLFVGQYQWSETAGWTSPRGVQVVSAADWIDGLTVGDFVTGPGLDKYGSQLEGRCQVLPAETRVPTAATIAALGVRQLAAGETCDPQTLEPLYLRRSSAEVQWERLHPAAPQAGTEC